MDFELNSTVFYKKEKSKLFQVLNLELKDPKKGQFKLELKIAGWEKTFSFKDSLKKNFEILIPPLDKNTKCKADLSLGDLNIAKEILLKYHRKWEIHLQNFTHTDIGYTDLPSRVAWGYQESMDYIIDFCRETEKFDDWSKYRWNVETGYWLENAIKKLDSRQLTIVKKLVKEGRIEITPLYVAHTSEFNDEETLIRSLYFAFEFAKSCGAKIETAMASDVTGQPWLLTQVLTKSGIRYFSTGVNATMAKALKLPRPFYWEGMDGSKILLLDTDERQAYQEGIMVGFAQDYSTVFKKLPFYLMDLEDNNSYAFDLLALRNPGYPGDNTKPNVKSSYIVKEWNSNWEYPKLKISTYSSYFRKFENKYGKQLETHKGAWPDWWVNYNGASAFETGVNRHTHTDILNSERLYTILKSLDKKTDYPEDKFKYIYKKMLLADEADWSSYLSAAEPDCLQQKGQQAEEASYVYQAAINARELKEICIDKLSKITKYGSDYAILVVNTLNKERSEIAEVAIPKKKVSPDKGFSIVDIEDNSEVGFQIIDSTQHDFQTGCFRVSFNAEGIPPMGFKVYKVIVSGGEVKKFKDIEPSGTLENDFYKITYDSKTGDIKSIIDKELEKDLIDKKSSYNFNQFIYETTVKPRIVDLSEHEGFHEEVLFLQPHFRKLHKEFYDYPPKGTEFRRISPENKKILKIRKGGIYSEIITIASTGLCPKIESHIRLDNNYKKIEVKNYLEKYETLDVEAVYYAFPFNFSRPKFNINCHGGYYELENGQLPGSSRDWNCVQKYIDLSGNNLNVIWSPMEAPLVQLTGINTSKWLDRIDVNNGTIFSFPLNNHWWTNSPPGQGGRFCFNYSITSKKPPFNPEFSNEFGLNHHVPLETKFTGKKEDGGRYGKFSFIDKLPGNINIVSLKKARESEDIIIRFLELSGKGTNFDFGLKEKKIKGAYIANPVEEIIENLKVFRGKIKVVMKPYELITLKIKI